MNLCPHGMRVAVVDGGRRSNVHTTIGELCTRRGKRPRGREFVRWRGEERKGRDVMGWIDRGYGCVVEGMYGRTSWWSNE